MPVIEYDKACESCKETGLYVGLAERDGSAVVCDTCKGTGLVHMRTEYAEPTGRKVRPEVTRVVEVNPGVVIGVGGVNQYRIEDFGGMPYTDWLAGQPFPPKSENRRFTCPAWWYQSADYEKRPNWKECGFGIFSRCDHFPEKDKCWSRFDAEQVQA